MCRAIWVLAVAPSEEGGRRLRALAGIETQVVATASDLAGVKETIGQKLDAAVLDARTPDATAILALISSEQPGLPVVWIGESAPAGTRVTVSPERVADDLPKAILRAVSQRG